MIVHGPISFLTRHCASRLEWFIPRKIPSNATTALATLHNITCLVHMYITFNHYSIHNIEFVEMKQSNYDRKLICTNRCLLVNVILGVLYQNKGIVAIVILLGFQHAKVRDAASSIVQTWHVLNRKPSKYISARIDKHIAQLSPVYKYEKGVTLRSFSLFQRLVLWKGEIGGYTIKYPWVRKLIIELMRDLKGLAEGSKIAATSQS